MTILYFVLILIGLILVHEFGHFFVAKLFGIRVEEFGVGFPPRLFVIKKGETEYTFNLLLIGGFVRIYGENPDTPITNAQDSRALWGKPRIVQAAVVVAGVVCNMLFAVLVLAAGYTVGLPTPLEHRGVGQVQGAKVTVVGVLPNSPAHKAGLAAGDSIESIVSATAQVEPKVGRNGGEVQEFISAHDYQSLIFNIKRGSETKSILVKPEEGVVEGRKAVGIELSDIGVLKLPVHLALLQGSVAGEQLFVQTAEGLGQFLFSLVNGAADISGLAGPIGIVQIGSGVLAQGFAAGVMLTAFISINLAIINLLPVPGLDGGRLVIIAVEGLRGRPISPAVASAITLAGFALLLLIFITVSVHDIARLVG